MIIKFHTQLSTDGHTINFRLFILVQLIRVYREEILLWYSIKMQLNLLDAASFCESLRHVLCVQCKKCKKNPSLGHHLDFIYSFHWFNLEELRMITVFLLLTA